MVMICWGIISSANAQTKNDGKAQEVKYRRSSLHMIIIEDAGLIKADLIKDAFFKGPLPDKYNDHSLPGRSFQPKNYPLTDAEKSTVKAQSGFGKSMSGIASNATGGLVDTTNTRYLPMIIDKYFVKEHIARDLVSKWFNRSATGTFDMKLIGDRGSYNASEMEANIAKSSARGLASISDAGEELIGNTFVVVNRLNYVNKAEIGQAANKVMGAVGGMFGGYVKLATDVASAGVEMAAKGYVVRTTSYLYQLVWNDSVAAVFYQNLWIDNSNPDMKKKDAYDQTNLFTLKFIGSETAWADVQSSVFSNKSEDDLVRKATINAVDAVIAKLQKKYEVFKTKTPLFTGFPITAKIGLKEDLEAGDKFEVLEQTIDEKTGKTTYVSKGKIKVEKNRIWDNRYTAGLEQKADSKAVGPDGAPLDRTYFTGGKDYYAGMLIRQIK